jgi:hypothetical protein
MLATRDALSLPPDGLKDTRASLEVGRIDPLKHIQARGQVVKVQ